MYYNIFSAGGGGEMGMLKAFSRTMNNFKFKRTPAKAFAVRRNVCTFLKLLQAEIYIHFLFALKWKCIFSFSLSNVFIA
jgi:hypothetical protein